MRAFAVIFAAAAWLHAPAAWSVTIGGNPGPEHNYVCPHADGEAPVECYFDAVQHLYTMCRNVKSIEVIEFGYEKSLEGTNGAKSDSCLDKQKANIDAPFKAALKQIRKSKLGTEGLHSLQQTWLAAMSALKWVEGETDEQYKLRVAKPYDDFKERIATIRTTLVAEAPAKAAPTQAAAARKPAHKSKAPAKAKPN